MKEIIAERDKSFFFLVTGVGFISMVASVIALIYIPNYLWFYIFGISVMGLITLVGVIGLCFPKWVIIRKSNTIIIHNGFRSFKKITLNLTDIVDVKVQELPQQSKVKHNGNIILTVKSESSLTKNIVVINVKSTLNVVEKLNSLIQK